MKDFKKKVIVDGTEYSVGSINNLPALCITTFLQDHEGFNLEIETRSLTIIPAVLLRLLENWETDIKGFIKKIKEEIIKAKGVVDVSEIKEIEEFEKTLEHSLAYSYMNNQSNTNKFAALTKGWEFVTSDYYGLLQNKFYFVRMLESYVQIRVLCFSKNTHKGKPILYDVKTLVAPKELFYKGD